MVSLKDRGKRCAKREGSDFYVGSELGLVLLDETVVGGNVTTVEGKKEL